MPAPKRVKSSRTKPKLVGVITTADELRRAIRMSNPPDLFELRLDMLKDVPSLEYNAPKLKAPVIITARHPNEGGKGRLTDGQRCELLLRMLPVAAYVDVELRSLPPCRRVLER